MDEKKKLRCRLFGDPLNGENLDGRPRHIAMARRVATRGNGGDFIEHIESLGDLTKHAIAEALHGGIFEIEEIVISVIDEELARCGIDDGRARHGEGTAVIFKTILGFIFDGCTGWFLIHIGSKAAPLNHEIGDDTVEDGAIIEARIDVGEEVGHSDGCFFGIQFGFEGSEGSFDNNRSRHRRVLLS